MVVPRCSRHPRRAGTRWSRRSLLGVAAHRNVPSAAFALLWRALGHDGQEPLALGAAGGDCVRADLVRRQQDAEVPSQPDDGGLGGHVGWSGRRAAVLGRAGCDAHDRAAAARIAGRPLGRTGRRCARSGRTPGPTRRVAALRACADADGPAAHPAGGVHQPVEPPEVRHGLADCPLDAGRIGHVNVEGQVPLGRAELGGDPASSFAVEVGQGDLRPLGRELPGYRTSDPVGRPVMRMMRSGKSPDMVPPSKSILFLMGEQAEALVVLRRVITNAQAGERRTCITIGAWQPNLAFRSCDVHAGAWAKLQSSPSLSDGLCAQGRDHCCATPECIASSQRDSGTGVTITRREGGRFA